MGWRFNGNEMKYIKEVLDSDFKSSAAGSMLGRFEKAFAQKLGVRYAVGINSGTSALHAALAACDVGPSDEVIMPSMTVVMCAYAILASGARPIFADVDRNTLLIDPRDIARKISSKTKAIMPVHMYGQICDMSSIASIAQRHGIKIIEDSAQCHLGRVNGKAGGTIGNIGCFSLGDTKMISTNEGGVVTTNDENLATRVRKFAYLGFKNLKADNVSMRVDPMIFQNPAYLRHDSFAYSYFMSEVDAAIGLAQVERIEWFLEKRGKMGRMYLEAVDGCHWFTPQYTPAGHEHAHWTFVACLQTEKKPNLTWHDFRNKFVELGGDKIRASYALVYNEPSVKNILENGRYFTDSRRVQSCSPIGEIKPRCPNAEYLQPRLMFFTTNQNTEQEMQKQAEALKKTIDFFGRK